MDSIGMDAGLNGRRAQQSTSRVREQHSPPRTTRQQYSPQPPGAPGPPRPQPHESLQSDLTSTAGYTLSGAYERQQQRSLEEASPALTAGM